MNMFSSFRAGKVLFLFSLIGLLGSTAGLARVFYEENSSLQPANGGEYREGAVGIFPPQYTFNPLFAEGFEKDISELLFSGLMKYDPRDGEIKDYLATHTLSEDKKTYEFTLLPDVFWQDGQKITAEDIIFTYRYVIQDPDFSNLLLKKAFADVIIKRINERTVQFILPEKQKTFFTNFTIGLLPSHQLTDVPIANINANLFSQNPIGNGPFRFESVVQEKGITEVRLLANDRFFKGRPHIDTFIFRIFPNNESLLKNIKTLDSIRPMLLSDAGPFLAEKRFLQKQTISPRYLAVFFNMKDENLTTKKIRQAMRAAIDTTAMAKKFKGERVDVPLVELWPQKNIINISPETSGKLLNSIGYFFEDERPKKSVARSDVKNKYITSPSNEKWYATEKTQFYILGKTPQKTASVVVNGHKLSLFNPQKGTFSYNASQKLGTLKAGKNIYTVLFSDGDGKILDTEKMTIVQESDPEAIVRIRVDHEKSAQKVRTKELKKENVQSPSFRTNTDKKHIRLTLTYLQGFSYLEDISQGMKEDWKKIGIEVGLRPLSGNEFRRALETRDFEMILAPQHLGYNLDIYPYFHLSQVGEGGFNISDWKNLEASFLLEEIRANHDANQRRESLKKLRDILIREVPAFFLYTPKNVWFVDARIKNVDIRHMAIPSDRFSNIHLFFVQEKRQYNEDKKVLDFFPWLFDRSKTLFSFSHS